jgi:hypothetical protein
MKRWALTRRLITPAGFVAVAACFLLPFVTVSCSALPGMSATATYRGVDLAAGAQAQITVSDEIRRDAGQAPSIDGAPIPTIAQMRDEYSKPIPVQPFIIVVLVLLGLGAVSAFVQAPWPRALAESGLAAGGLPFLAGGEVLARHASTIRVTNDATPFAGNAQGVLQPHVGTTIQTRTGIGFWLAASLLVLVTALSLTRLVRLSTRSAAVPDG